MRKVSTEIDHIDPNIIDMAKSMKKLTQKRDGVGLAAPQIGLNKRLIYTTQWSKDNKGELQFR